MENIRKLRKQKESDRRTALLGLAASASGEKEIDCLNSEQIACLVAKKCSATEQQLFFEHLAGCERCYGQWLELYEIKAEEQKGRGKRGGIRPFKIKNLAWAGSALAAAASVVLYLNIVRDAAQPLYKAQIPLENSIERTGAQQKNELPDESKAGRADAQQFEKGLVAPASSAGKSSLQTAQSKKVRARAVTDETGLAGSTEPGDLMMLEAAPVSKERETQMLAAPEPAKSSLTLDSWFTTVGQGCLEEKEQNTVFWQEQYAAGATLLRQRRRGPAGFEAEEQGRNIEQILRVVGRLAQGERAGNPCGEIKELLP